MSEDITNTLSREENQEQKMQRRNHRRQTLLRLEQQEDHFLNECITTAEDERTVIAKNDTTNSKRRSIEAAHKKSQPISKPGYAQRVRNATYTATTQFNRAFSKLFAQKRVLFRLCPESNYWGKKKREEANGVLITYDSGADGTYISKADRKEHDCPYYEHQRKGYG
jgi:hypothetical protein